MLGPLITNFFSRSRFHWDTVSGIVSFLATSTGTPTFEMARFGSGEITVRLEKSTLSPLIFESEFLEVVPTYDELVGSPTLHCQNKWLHDTVIDLPNLVRLVEV